MKKLLKMKVKGKKTNGNIKEIEDPKKISNKTARSGMMCVTLKRVSPRIKAKRDVLNTSPNNVSKKNINSNKLKDSLGTLDAHQPEETSKSCSSQDGRMKKSYEKNLNVSIQKTCTRSSTILDQNFPEKSPFNKLFEKVNYSAEIQDKDIKTLPNSSVLYSNTYNKVAKKRKHIVPDVKKNNKKKKENIPVDLFTATPISFNKSQIKKAKESEVTSAPLNKKAPLKLDVFSCKGKKRSLKKKRCVNNTLKENSEGYEDDIFESREFDKFKENLLMDDDSDIYDLNIATPKCTFLGTPKMPKKTPRSKNCYNPMELMKARVLAEEYICLRNERKLKNSLNSENSLQERNMNQQNEK